MLVSSLLACACACLVVNTVLAMAKFSREEEVSRRDVSAEEAEINQSQYLEDLL